MTSGGECCRVNRLLSSRKARPFVSLRARPRLAASSPGARRADFCAGRDIFHPQQWKHGGRCRRKWLAGWLAEQRSRHARRGRGQSLHPFEEPRTERHGPAFSEDSLAGRNAGLGNGLAAESDGSAPGFEAMVRRPHHARVSRCLGQCDKRSSRRAVCAQVDGCPAG